MYKFIQPVVKRFYVRHGMREIVRLSSVLSDLIEMLARASKKRPQFDRGRADAAQSLCRAHRGSEENTDFCRLDDDDLENICIASFSKNIAKLRR